MSTSTPLARPDDLPSGLTVDEFLAWAEGRSGRYELHAGTVVAMAPERAGHALVKFAVQKQLEKGISAAGVSCQMFPDGMTVRIDRDQAYEPDALVNCGPRLDLNVTEAPNPVVVVEVLSPSTQVIDIGTKLIDYFRVPSIQHYIIVDPTKPPVIVHSRQTDGTITTRIVGAGTQRLDPPGIDIDVLQFFA